MTADPTLPALGQFDPEIPALPSGTRLITLENGLVIIVREDASAPVVSVQAWCKSGSIDEGKWLGAGLSHILEHMLFKGTTTRGAGRIDQEVQDAGGYLNAYTSFDRTVFWINVPNTGAEVALDILCDIMQNATLPPEELAREKQVILREMDMNQDDPGRRASRRLFETAYARSPYRYTVIGYPDIFNEVQREDVLAYYREKYVPNNLFFVVVGQIKAEAVEAQIRRAFAQAKARPLPPVVLPLEPRQTAQREVIEEGPIELGHFHFAWHIPDVRHSDVPALDVLATLLGNGHSSRLYQQAREKQGVVHSTDAWTYNHSQPGLLGLSAIVEPGKFESARTALLGEVERIKSDLIPAAELSKASKQFTAAMLATRKSMQGQAQDLGGSWLAANDLNFSERFLAAVKRVTPADLQRVARQYLTTDNRSLYALLPAGTAMKPSDALPSIADQPIQKCELANGLRLLVKEDHRLPFVEMRAVFQGGVLLETEANNGLTLLLAKMLLKGTATRTGEQIATEIESLGGSIDSYGGNNSLGVTAEVMSDDFVQGLHLFADVMLQPVFPGSALEREKQVQLASIKAQNDQLLPSAGRSLRRLLFGARGFGLDIHGSEESVPKIHVADLRAFYGQVLAPDNCVMAIYGDVQTGDVQEAVRRIFGQWQRRKAVSAEHGHTSPLRQVVRAVETRDKKQAVIVVGFPGVSLRDANRYALDLLQEALSDLGSRLFVRIREKLGLAYYVGAQNFTGLQPGYFAVYAGTAPEKASVVEAEMFKEIASLRAEGLSAEELKRAKAKLIGQKKIARQDLGVYATATALDELYGLGYANSETEDALYEAVTLAQVQALIRDYLNPEACAVAIIRPDRP
ncbi:MAG: pitrilysin family protein [Verrucomicrobiota bacterium]